MVEAQACGTPVIGFAEGGARDIIRSATGNAPTGILFSEQTTRSIVDAVARFEALEAGFSATACRENALRFTEEKFREAMTTLISDAMLSGKRV
jgi:glycosyltransferase involved in cell wall biosynthesis